MRLSFLLLILMLAAAGELRGETAAGHDLSNAEELAQDMSSKLSRGVANILTGWGEIPRQMIKSGRDKGWWAVVPVGLPSGAIMTVVRTATGAFETAFFFAPIRDSYAPIIEPAFVWERFETRDAGRGM